MTAKIHMDVDSVRAVAALLERRKGEMEGFIRDVSIAVNGLEGGEWIGNAPAQFYDEYVAFRRDLIKQVEYMGALADRLGRAIADFEAAAAKLS
ncbi:MAG: WXG100 family type VII secretion target [Anaerolineales bacterium]|nr:WXG100 family type VII secretion target [Anaerolineales bacterium]